MAGSQNQIIIPAIITAKSTKKSSYTIWNELKQHTCIYATLLYVVDIYDDTHAGISISKSIHSVFFFSRFFKCLNFSVSNFQIVLVKWMIAWSPILGSRTAGSTWVSFSIEKSWVLWTFHPFRAMFSHLLINRINFSPMQWYIRIY